MKKTLLAAGDSLMAGNYGASLMEYVNCSKDLNIINEAQDGATLKEVIRNLDKYLKESLSMEPFSLPDILLLDGGANDLLIPYMDRLYPGTWTHLIRTLNRRGSYPLAEESEFAEIIEHAIRSALTSGIESVVILTLPCLGEDLDSHLNRKKALYNDRIQSLIRDCFSSDPVFIADAGRAFDDVLKPLQPGSAWMFTSPDDLEKDRLYYDKGGSDESLFQERGLYLTMDGVHLNRKGAFLTGQIVNSVLEQIL